MFDALKQTTSLESLDHSDLEMDRKTLDLLMHLAEQPSLHIYKARAILDQRDKLFSLKNKLATESLDIHTVLQLVNEDESLSRILNLATEDLQEMSPEEISLSIEALYDIGLEEVANELSTHRDSISLENVEIFTMILRAITAVVITVGMKILKDKLETGMVEAPTESTLRFLITKLDCFQRIHGLIKGLAIPSDEATYERFLAGLLGRQADFEDIGVELSRRKIVFFIKTKDLVISSVPVEYLTEKNYPSSLGYKDGSLKYLTDAYQKGLASVNKVVPELEALLLDYNTQCTALVNDGSVDKLTREFRMSALMNLIELTQFTLSRSITIIRYIEAALAKVADFYKAPGAAA